MTKQPYLTKRLLIRASKAAIKKAAENTMQIMGYNVIAKDGWVVKLYADGHIEKMKKLPYIKRPENIILD